MGTTSQDRNLRALRGRYVFPVTSPPLAGGVVVIDGQRIAALGAAAGFSSSARSTVGQAGHHAQRGRGTRAGLEVEDLGNVAILPGLVNAHTHLEFSNLARPLGEPGIGFADWIRLVVESRRRAAARQSFMEWIGRVFRRRAAAQKSTTEIGLQESALLGTTALGEIARPGWPAEQVQRTALDTTVFLELIAPTTARVPPALTLAREHLKEHSTWRPGLSPHAPYSVHPDLLAGVVALSAEHRVPLAMHLAESQEELELLRSGSGPLRDLFEEWGVAESFRPIANYSPPLDYLRTLASAHRALIVHGNYLDEEEIAFLAAHAQRMAVVYCPRTHAFFRHAAYPLEKMLAAGVKVALGTDSRASSPDLSVLAEMRHVAANHPAVGGDVLLKLATLHGAAALGLDGELGSLEPGKYADLAIVALPDRDAADPHELLLNSDRPVVATWRRGIKIS